jgi:glyoxylase-like metal-dependent hydrolase (beta-lactamase superfamily II)
MTFLVETFPVGPLGCNCSIVADGASAVVIDPGDEPERILGVLRAHGLRCHTLLHTHAHLDHVLGTGRLQAETGATVALHPGDLPLWENVPMQASWVGWRPPPAPPPVQHELVDGEHIAIGQKRLQVVHTPGHTPGSTCFHEVGERLLFSGDTLFRFGVGRVDLGGLGMDVLLDSIRTRILTLPPETRVIPGHGPATTVGEEIAGNPFLRPGAWW